MSDNFHALAKDAGNKLRAYILSISSAATGVFFLSLTTEKVTSLTSLERNSVFIAFTCFAATALLCIIELRVDAKRFYRIAKENEKEKETQEWSWNTDLKILRLMLIYGSYFTLATASVSTLVYMFSKIYGR